MKNTIPLNNNTITPDNYEELLLSHHLLSKKNDYYWETGYIPDMQGWIFYIPISINDITFLLEKLIPYLKKENIAFKIPLEKGWHHNIKEGIMGKELFGKIICIYPENQNKLKDIAVYLIRITEEFQGTLVASAVHLGGLLYTRYGRFHTFSTPSGDLIISDEGNFVQDDYSIPYRIPQWLSWPFDEIASPIPRKQEMLLGNKYLIKDIIRNPYKGRIMIGLYQKNLIQFKKCLIKEGIKGMLSDEENRDISDRLKWQKELHQKLDKNIPIPKFIDFFQENGNSYLVLQYIDGSKFETHIEEIFLFNSWLGLPDPKKNIIIDYLLEIIQIFDNLHQIGIVHRDITLPNFIVNKNNKIYLIDLELSYSINNKYPSPPFQVGTDGYMSPEQAKAKVCPDYMQDIFSIGSVIMAIIIRLSPKKMIHINQEDLKNSLNFFTGNTVLASIILQCLNEDSSKRPTLLEIKKSLLAYKSNPITHFPETILESVKLKNLIQNSANSIKNPVMTNKAGIWISQVEIQNKNRNIYIGLQKGISGILLLISELKKNGFDISCLKESIEKNWSFLNENYLVAGQDVPTGLYNGSSGVALALASIIESELISNKEELAINIYNCLFKIPSSYDVEKGIAGYGLCLLKCKNYLPSDFFNERLRIVMNQILNAQQKNGAWLFQVNSESVISGKTGFETGVAGITYFLLECVAITNDNTIINKITLALTWLKQQYRKFGDNILWPTHSKTKEGTMFVNGTFGIAITFIKAYEILGNIQYKRIAEQALSSMPPNAIVTDFTFSSGLAGIGEVYLYAYKTFKEKKWRERADWIGNIFINTKVTFANEAYWIQNIIDTPSADLMEGNGAIIHFLLGLISSNPNPFIFRILS